MFRFTIRQIEIFLKVCELGSFRRAAEMLGVSEAAVSDHVRKLEEQLGTELFVRRRGATGELSPTGESFRLGALSFVEQGLALGRLGAPASGQISLTIYTGPHLLEDLIRPALAGFLAANPDLDLHFAMTPSRKWLQQQIAAGGVDGAVLNVRGPAQLPHSEMIARTTMGIFAAPALADQARCGGLSSIPFLAPSDLGKDWGGWLAALRRAGVVRPRIVARFPFHDVGMRMAREGVGAIATLDSIVETLAPEGALQLVRRMADWETRLYLNPRIGPDQARRLRQFFALVAARDEAEAMRAAAQEVAPRLRAS